MCIETGVRVACGWRAILAQLEAQLIHRRPCPLHTSLLRKPLMSAEAHSVESMCL